MAQKFLSNIELEAGLVDANGNTGTSGQILSSTGSGVDWIPQGDIVVGEADKAKTVILRVKNSTASAMTKGQVICEAVSASPPSGNLIEVALADNDGTNTMPALGILNEDLDAAGGANDEGDAVMFGKVSGINTSAFSVGDEVFVDSTPGGLTTTKPTGVKYIQKVGVVIRDDATNGTIEVFGAGRVNDVPTPLYVNHLQQRLGVGVLQPNVRLDVSGNAFIGSLHSSTTIGQDATAIGQENEVSGFASFAGNQLNVASGAQSAAFNYSNTASGGASFATGSNNTVSGVGSFSNGNGNTVSGAYNGSFGASNTVSGSYGFSSGENNEVKGNWNTAFGFDNFVEGGTVTAVGCNAVLGRGNEINSQFSGYNIVGGLGNTLGVNASSNDPASANIVGGAYNTNYWAENCLIVGGSNTIGSASVQDNAGTGSIMGGYNNFNSGSYAIVSGYQNTNFSNAGLVLGLGSTGSTGDRQFAIGEGITTPTSASAAYIANQFVIGQYNEYSGITTGHLFAVGNGVNDTSRSTAFCVLPNGNVGIDTNGPKSRLHVTSYTSGTGSLPVIASDTLILAETIPASVANANISVLSGTSATASISFGDSGAEKRGAVNYLNGSDEMRFRTAAADRVTIKSDGDVGIGTTNPLAKLHVDQTANAQGVRVESDNVQPSITFVDGATSDYWEIGYNRSGERLVFEYNNTELAVLRENGNFGVGAGLIPSSKLHVDGTGRFNDFVIAGSGSGGVGLTDNDGYGNANVTFNHVSGVPEQNGQSGRIEVNTDNTTTVGEMFFELSGAPVTSGVAVGLSTALKLTPNNVDVPYRVRHLDDTDTWMQFDTDRIRLAAGGTTFLDSNTPPVSNSGTGIAGYVAKYTGASTIDDGIIYDSGTAIGIGTANPNSTLHVEGSGIAIANGSNTKTTLIPSGGGNSELTLKGQNWNHYVNFETSWNSFRYARLKSSYSTSDSEFYLYKSNSSGGTAATTTISTGNSNFSGKVGIGNPSPSAFLDIDNIGSGVTAISVSAGTNEQFSVRTDGTNNGVVHVKGNDAATRVYLAGTSGASSYFTEKLGVGKSSDIRANLDVEGPVRVIGGTFTSGASGADSNASTGIVLRRGKKLFSGIPNGANEDFYLRSLIEQTSSNEIIIGQGGTALITDISLKPGTSGNVRFFTTGSETMRINSSGNVGIGTTNPTTHLHVEGSAQGAKIVSTQSVGIEVQGGGNSSDIAIFRNTSGNEEFSIDTNGVLYSLGMASSSSSNANLMHNPTTGQIYRYSSSIRYKEDVTDLESAVNKIQKLRPVKFKVKQTGEYNTGMIAEEVAEVMPEITYKADVEGFDAPQVDGITYEPLHAYYIKAIQELSSKIEQLESRIQTLENN